MKILAKIPTSITLLFWMTVLTGMLYPLAVTGIAQLLFPHRADGSLIVIEGQVRGSALLAQKFESARFFRARPSATDYAYLGSGASNLADTNSALAKAVRDNRDAWLKAFGPPPIGARVPPEMLYASASGLDPDISPEAALAQVDSVAAARALDAGAKAELVDAIARAASSATSIIGPPRVDVVELNAKLETDPRFAGTK
jgi:K+-transporting ATPase ATPase C chain